MKKRVFITGSSRGIGKAIAKDLIKDDFSVILHGKSLSPHLKETLEECKSLDPETQVLSFDITQRELAKECLENDIKEHGGYYGIVLSAGAHQDMPFPAMTDEAWDNVLSVDLDGFYNTLRPVIMPMIQLRKGGRIVCISSLSGVVGNRGQVNYSAAKAGIIGASKALARELAKRKITVNCVAPGGIETDMIDAKLKEEMIKVIPMARLGTPEEISASVRYLFSPEAEYMTGQTLVLSGGLF